MHAGAVRHLWQRLQHSYVGANSSHAAQQISRPQKSILHILAISAAAVNVKHEGAARHSANELQPEQHLDNDQNRLGTMGKPRTHSVSFSACHSKFPELWAPINPATATQDFSSGTSLGVLVLQLCLCGLNITHCGTLNL